MDSLQSLIFVDIVDVAIAVVFIATFNFQLSVKHFMVLRYIVAQYLGSCKFFHVCIFLNHHFTAIRSDFGIRHYYVFDLLTSELGFL